ncbi:aldo/keto reductase [Amycolatopsis sp. YIM 10]|uniref:aldo/keto reductase n=1 Tax=Amycolatopsis sp. YIM 10 TaxID=2653857 RepID=UPI00128FF35B|nr:aldo/keto reductase [Amycolatopsis sp. YIM 10]QFU90076.1 L-glyceraldehyde 3-phosphate reductase [Amycolatopsis sp. YIM 10]
MSTMRYRLLGRSGVRVSELCLGTMMFGYPGLGVATAGEAAGALKRFADAGGNFLDTANQYAGGESERVVGELIRPDRDRWVLGTKYGLSSDPADPNAGGTHRKNLRRAVEASLRRLGTDYLDLYWVHIWDSYTPIEEVVTALDDLVRSGKVLYLGISDTPAWLVARAVTIAEERGLTPFSAIQVPYSLVERTVERELLPMAKALDLAVTGWAPLGGGLLTGRYGSDRERPAEGRRSGGEIDERELAIADTVNAIAEARGASASQVALAWLRAQQHRALTIPIVGIRNEDQLADNLRLIDLEPEELRRLDEATALSPEFPHGFDGERYAHGDAVVDYHRA